MNDSQAVAMIAVWFLIANENYDNPAMFDRTVEYAASVLEKSKLEVRKRQQDETPLGAGEKRSAVWQLP